MNPYSQTGPLMSRPHRDYFNNLADEWNTLMPDNDSLRDHLIRFGIQEGDIVLDIGAGTGRMTHHLSELTGEKGFVVAEDVAIKMLTNGKSVMTDRAHWLCDTVDQLAIKNSVFHKILCFSAFPHFQSPSSALKEMHRVLKPGGELLILHLSSSDQLNRFHASLDGIVNQDRLGSAHELSALCEKCGFEPVLSEEKDQHYWVQVRKSAQ